MDGDRGRRGQPAPVVVKLGGSLIEGMDADGGARVKAILGIIRRTRVPVVVVPGGGPFADTVRREQQRLGLSDAAAHRMALLAMHQTAEALLDLEPEPRRLAITASVREIGAALGAGRIALWVPRPMADGDPDIPEDWSVTSDGLAAWLAVRIGARQVVLLKPAAVEAGATAAGLAAAGVVDPTFARIVAAAGIGWSVLGPGEAAALAEALGAEMQPDSSGAASTAPGDARRR